MTASSDRPAAGLTVHRAERADVLVAALAETLAAPLADPFASEVVAVPAKGVERWLAQRLSHRLGTVTGDDGVCAGIRFPSPAELLDGAVATAAGLAPEHDPWQPSRLAWPLLQVIDESAAEPWCAPLHAHLGGGRAGDPRRGRRLATARRLAELFAGYANHRPELLRGWAAGDQTGTPRDLRWQPELWRRVAARIDGPDPVRRLADACAALRRSPDLVSLPDRLSIFGPTRLAAAQLSVLVALAQHRQVHLWLPHPSPGLWAAVAAVCPSEVPPRRTDPTASIGRNALLSSLGRDVRELQLRLAVAAPQAAHEHHPAPDLPDTLLGRLQRRLRDDLPSELDRHTAPGPADRSVQVHACHGSHRQAEVLREVVVGLLADDPTLEPRDIVVMCPDVETFAPLITAVFGQGEPGGQGHPGHRLPVRLADRAPRQLNPLLNTVAALLELAESRLTAAQALDLLATEPVRLRFGLDDADLDRISTLVRDVGVRWGLDATHRGRYQLAGYPQNTWAAGLDRLLLSVALSHGPDDAAGSAWLGTALPADGVEPGHTRLIGRLAEFLDRLAHTLSALSGERPLAEWTAVLTAGLDALTGTTDANAWQRMQAHGELAAAVDEAGGHAGTVPLRLADLRALLDDRLRGRPSRTGFRTGTITVATLVPMRSVPHRVVCLLGLDDGVFPRADVPDGDDLLARDPVAGERDPRSEDRQLLLDAVCAATEHLVVVHSGADERTGARRPPAVPLGELLDAIEGDVGDASGALVRHPLQPFDTRNFLPAALGTTRPFSFDRAELAGAQAGLAPRRPPAPFLSAPLAPPPADHGDGFGRVVTLDELTGFLEHPVRGFLRQRVGLPPASRPEQPADALPVRLDGLATWRIGDRLLRDRLAGVAPDRCRQAEWRRGELPPGALGHSLLGQLLEQVEALVAAAQPARAEPLPEVDLDVLLPDGRRLAGTVGQLYRTVEGPTLLSVVYSRLAPKHRLRAWATLLALTAADGQPWQAITVGRGERHGLRRSRLGPIPMARATELVAQLVELRDTGLREPLPLATATGHAYVRSIQGGATPQDAAASAVKAWGTGAGAEQKDAEHHRVWGPLPGMEVLLAQPGPVGGEPTRFGTLARKLWEPLLRAEDEVRV